MLRPQIFKSLPLTGGDVEEAAPDVEPAAAHASVARASAEELAAWEADGLGAVARGELALVLLAGARRCSAAERSTAHTTPARCAGGQGTRLGSADPKGMYDIGLPSGKSLFQARPSLETHNSQSLHRSDILLVLLPRQLQAERIAALRRLASARSGGACKPLPWYIMTSAATRAKTEAFFVAHKHFGLPASDVRFFDQGWLPPLSPSSGAMVLASRAALAAAPDGNGGVFAALRASGCLADMASRGAQGAYVYCVDNALVRVGDPALVGFCRATAAAAGAKVVPRAGPAEAVGVFCADRGTGALRVVEYTELPPALASASDPDTGALRFNAANVALHYFSLPFLRRCCGADDPSRKRKAGDIEGDVPLAPALPYHAALKKVPCVADAAPSAPNALKLEAFIFDVYPAAGADVALLEGVRCDDFAPVKNAEGAGRDSPDTARALLCAQHRRWAVAAGAVIEGEGLFEIDAALSYAGEGLDAMKGRTYTAPCHVATL